MVKASDVYNLVQHKFAKVANELQEVVILVWLTSHSFFSCYYNKTSWGSVSHNICEFFILQVKRSKLTL